MVSIKPIKMIIPIGVFCVVVHGIAGAGDLKRVGRVGVKGLIYFEVLTTIALGMGLVLAFVFEPGVGMNVDTSKLDASAMAAYASNADKLTSGGTVDFLMKLIPTTVVEVSPRATCCRCCCSPCCSARADHAGRTRQARSALVDALSMALFKVMGIIIAGTALGVLGAIAFTVGQYGIGSLKQLGMLVALFYVSVLIFVFVVLVW